MVVIKYIFLPLSFQLGRSFFTVTPGSNLQLTICFTFLTLIFHVKTWPPLQCSRQTHIRPTPCFIHMSTTGHPVVSKMTSSPVPYCHESHAFHSLASPSALVISVKTVALLMMLHSFPSGSSFRSGGWQMSLTFNFPFSFDIVMSVNVSEPLILHSFFQQHINAVPVTWCFMSHSPKSRDALWPSWYLSSYFIYLFILSFRPKCSTCHSA